MGAWVWTLWRSEFWEVSLTIYLLPCLLYKSVIQFQYISARSKPIIQYLLDETSNLDNNSTITLWGTDTITDDGLQNLKLFVRDIGIERVFVDTSYDLNNLQTDYEGKVNNLTSLQEEKIKGPFKSLLLDFAGLVYKILL